MEYSEEKKSPFIIGGSIILAGLIIAGAIIYVSGALESGKNAIPQVDTVSNNAEQLFRPVDETDHIRGDKDAEVVLIEYSDTECPFCISFHETMRRVMNTYGDRVAWVYRHVPFHNQSEQEIIALECASDQGGNNAFWAYLDRLFAITPGNDEFDLALLPEIATYIGLNENTFNQCMKTKDVSSRIDRDVADAFNAGLKGTPFTLVVGKKAVFNIDGAQPFSVVSSFIEQALQ